MRDGAKNYVLNDISKSCGRLVIKQGGRVGKVTRTSRFSLVKVQIHIRPISGIQNLNNSASEVCPLLSAVPFRQMSLHEWFFLLGENFLLLSMLVCCICLSVCVTQFLATVLKQSFWTFFLYVVDQPRTAMLNFGEDPNSDPDTSIFFKNDSSPLRDWTKNYV